MHAAINLAFLDDDDDNNNKKKQHLHSTFFIPKVDGIKE